MDSAITHAMHWPSGGTFNSINLSPYPPYSMQWFSKYCRIIHILPIKWADSAPRYVIRTEIFISHQICSFNEQHVNDLAISQGPMHRKCWVRARMEAIEHALQPAAPNPTFYCTTLTTHIWASQSTSKVCKKSVLDSGEARYACNNALVNLNVRFIPKCDIWYSISLANSAHFIYGRWMIRLYLKNQCTEYVE